MKFYPSQLKNEGIQFVENDFYEPVIDPKTRHYPAPLEGFYRINLQCDNCLNEYVADIRKKISFMEVKDKIECPNCELLDVSKTVEL